MDIDRGALLREFLREASEQLDAMEQHLLALEAEGPGEEALAELFRAAHTLKGNARVVALPALEASSHTLEEVLERIKNGSQPVSQGLVSVLLRLVDSFRRIIPRAVEGHVDAHPEHEDLLQWLEGDGRAEGASIAERGDGGADPAPAGSSRSDASRTIRVGVSKLDRILDLMGEITIARGRLTNLLSVGQKDSYEELRNVHHDSDRLYLELQEQLMRARMVPLGPMFSLYHRAVRDICVLRGKQARLELMGEEVEVDTAVAERIRDPLMHMIGNAVDHGIESPEARRAANKPEVGRIVISARHVGGSVVVSMTDDGAGLDRDAILMRARALGWIAADERPSDGDLYKLIFEPGFSTSRSVDSVSGRGIGMDVVWQNVVALSGSVSVSSEPGQGTSITLRLPLTLAIIEGFRVGVGDETYIIPLDAVVECLDLPAEERRHRNSSGVIRLRDSVLPYVRLAHVVGVEPARSARESVVVVRHEDRCAGIVVDTLHGAEQTVVKPLAALVGDGSVISGCSLLGSGRIALILDVPNFLANVCERPVTSDAAQSQASVAAAS